MVQISWTVRAKEDLKSIAEYIKADSVRYAKLQVIKLKSRTQILKSHQKSGRVVPEIDNEQIRELIEGNFEISSGYSHNLSFVKRLNKKDYWLIHKVISKTISSNIS